MNTPCVFFCLSGVSIEFLCFPRPEEPIEHVMSCLQALFTLLESPCAKAHIAQDQVKPQNEELCGVVGDIGIFIPSLDFKLCNVMIFI